jgi:glutathione S-transferase
MKLYRLDYSPYARKVQMVLDLLGHEYECVDVPYGNRREMAELTGGWVLVPVLVGDGGEVTVESRLICEKLLQGDAAAKLVPSPLEGPIWAYSDWCDGPLEDVMFRIASPLQRKRFADAWESALYVFVKDRRFGAGCVDDWERSHETLVARAARMLEPSRRTLAQRPFLFGGAPTLADAALYGNLAMLEACDPGLPARLGPEFPAFARRLEKEKKNEQG